MLVSTPCSSRVELLDDALSLIIAESDVETLKQIRLCCKWLAQQAAQHLFATIEFHMCCEDMERVIGIANSITNGVARAVKILRLKQEPKLQSFLSKIGARLLTCYGVSLPDPVVL